jgi:hypothetical protein
VALAAGRISGAVAAAAGRSTGRAAIHRTNDPAFNAQYQRLVEVLRDAGVPEGSAKTN